MEEGRIMTPEIDKEFTALLVIDPYNDFISGRRQYGIKGVAETNQCVPRKPRTVLTPLVS
jgi:hypothetical protein